MKWIKSIFYVLLLVIILQFFMVYQNLNPLDLVDIPSLILIMSGLIFSLVHFKLSDILMAFSQAFGQTKLWEDEGRYRLSRKVFQTLGNYALIAAIFGTLVGFVQALGNIDDLKLLGVSFALSLLTLVYSIVLKFFIFQPLIIALDRQALDNQMEVQF